MILIGNSRLNPDFVDDGKGGSEHRLLAVPGIQAYKAEDFQTDDRAAYHTAGELIVKNYSDQEHITSYLNNLGANIECIEIYNSKDIAYQKAKVQVEYNKLGDGEKGRTYFVFDTTSDSYWIIEKPMSTNEAIVSIKRKPNERNAGIPQSLVIDALKGTNFS